MVKTGSQPVPRNQVLGHKEDRLGVREQAVAVVLEEASGRPVNTLLAHTDYDINLDTGKFYINITFYLIRNLHADKLWQHIAENVQGTGARMVTMRGADESTWKGEGARIEDPVACSSNTIESMHQGAPVAGSLAETNGMVVAKIAWHNSASCQGRA